MATSKISFVTDNTKQIDYKDVESLKAFLDDHAKINPRRVSKLNAKKQRELAQAIKRARFLGLLPYIQR